MIIEEITKKMIEYSNGNLHDINHFLKVLEFARIIGKLENLSEQEMEILEISAIVHDIACPLCRKKYGNTNGKLQEKEGEILARKFLTKLQINNELIERIVFLVAHHHTFSNIDGIDWQILLEADFLVNADESNINKKAVQSAKERLFRTKTGISLLETLYL